MKIRIKVIIAFIIAAAILTIAGIMVAAAWRTHQNHSYYVDIDKAEKDKVMSVINGNIGKNTDLHTYQILPEWIPETLDEQIKMMDSVLGSIKVLGEAKKGKPIRYIIAQYPDMTVYIPYEYKEKSFADKMVLEINKHYYLVSAKEKYVNIVIDYLNERIPFKPKTD